MNYVTYDPATGALTGGYLQDLQPAHAAHHIEVSADQRLNWPAYQANAARSGVEAADPAPPPAPIVPESVAMWQAREILIDEGMMTPIMAFINGMADPVAKEKALSKLEYSNTVRRDDPLVLYVIPALGKTEAQIDAMFIRAAAL
jgi:hypothetical protein